MERPAVSIRRCDDYDIGHVREALRKSLGDLGGMGAFVRKGERVVLKTNLLRGAPPS